MRPAIRLAALGVLLPLACGGSSQGEGEGAKSGPTPVEVTSSSPVPEETPEGPEGPVAPGPGPSPNTGSPEVAPDPGPFDPPVAPADEEVPGATYPRASTPAPVGGKAVKHVMVHEKLGHEVHALAAWPGSPDWAAPTGNLAAARDDDLLTGWNCASTDELACAYGLAFPDPVELRAIRLFGGNGTTRKEHRARPRIASVRLHTDAGTIDIDGVGDGDHFRWLVLDEAVKTEHLVVEVTGTHGPEGTISMAEIEVYGSSGLAREPLRLDPSRTWVSFADRAWGGKDKKQGIRRPFLQTIGATGEPRRVDHGTAVYGRAGERFALVEWLYGTNCEEHGLTYLLVDKQTRMWFHVGTLGNHLGLVRLRSDGLGFAVGPGEAKSWGLRHDVDREKVVRDKPDRLEWSAIDAVLQPRGGDREGRPLLASGCELTTDLGPLEAAKLGPDASWQWWRCGVGERSVWLGRGDGCDAAWAVHALEGEGTKLRSEKSGQDSSRPPRIQRGTDGSLFVEMVGRSVDRSEVLWIRPEGLVLDLGDGALAVRAPSVCETCNGAF